MELELDRWCEEHLGSKPAAQLWQRGHLSSVIAVTLEDNRSVVIKVRSWDEALPGCYAVHAHLWAAGFPCPRPLTGPTQHDGLAVSAEAYLPRGAPGRGDEPTLASRTARYLQRLISDAPSSESIPSLQPPRPWAGWTHPEADPWPPPDEGLPLNDHPAAAELKPLVQDLNQRLRSTPLNSVVGHVDWYQGNLRWDGDQLLAADDWDSVSLLPEAALAGCAAVSFRPGCPGVHSDGWPGAEVDDTQEFLDHYQAAAGRGFSREETEIAWAAGLWQRSFDAAKALVIGASQAASDQIRDSPRRRRRAGL